MAIKKDTKDRLVAEYIDLLTNATGIVVTEYRGLSMPKFNAIRTKMREVGSQYTVTKNTLLKIALDEVGYAIPEDLLAGPVAVGFAFGNLPGTVKALMDVAKDEELLMMKGAIARTDVYNQAQLKILAELPSMDELRATLIGMITQPASQLISLLVAPQRDVVSVLAAYIDKHEGGESAA